MTWADLFERAAAFGVAEDEVREALARRRARGGADGVDESGNDDEQGRPDRP